MECTQRLECTQDQDQTQTEEDIVAGQIGFLGICGTKYPVRKGPNKIGRDPSTCSIVLNLNSISRQHAVINVLNRRDFMLMDLDSANKTKLVGKPLKPYIPQPLHNGDTVQFGDVFGMFRLLEEEDDLPMTQAIDVPETPIVNKHASRCKPALIPESPDVSGDDSFVMPSQPCRSSHPFKSPSNKYIKPGGKTVSIQPIGSNKIDNVYWNSSKKSTSFNLDDTSTSVNDSTNSLKSNQDTNGDIHEMETQAPFPNDNTDSIYNAATQLPTESDSPSIHGLDTQLPTNLPDVRTVREQEDVQIDMYTANKENIFNAETQLFGSGVKKDGNENIFEVDTQIPSAGNSDDIFEAETQDLEDLVSKQENKNIFEADTQAPTWENYKSLNSSANDSIYNAETQLETDTNKSLDSKSSHDKSKDRSNMNRSDDIVLFDEVDTQDFAEPFDSQPILASEGLCNDDIINLTQTEPKLEEKKQATPVKRNIRIKSDSSTDCEDIEISPGQNDPKKSIEDDITDCEEDLFEDDKVKEVQIEQKKVPVPTGSKDMNTDFEDLPTQVLKEDPVDSPKKSISTVNIVSKEPNFEDLPTQVLPEDNVEENFEDMATQVLGDDIPADNLNEAETQQLLSEDIISPFKVPFPTPLKNKKRDSKPDPKLKLTIPEVKITPVISSDDDEKYYAATQNILDDLCTQKETSPEPVPEKESSKEKYLLDDALSSSDTEDKVNKFVNNLTKEEIKEVIGVDSQVRELKRVPSDPSDVEITPTKLKPFRYMGTDLPNSQEIKLSVSTTNKTLATESSSESDEDSQKQDTPMLIKKYKRIKPAAKIDLSKKFDSNVLPSRVITRVRKPTAKIMDNNAKDVKKINESILKPKYLTEQDDEPDKDIITENIIRLKSQNDKKTKPNDSLMDKSKKSSPKSNFIQNETVKTEETKPNASKDSSEVKSPLDTNDKKVNEKTENRKHSTRKDKNTDSKNKRKNSEQTEEKSKRPRRHDKIQDKEKNIIPVVTIDEETLTKTSEAILSTSNTYKKSETHKSTRSKNRSKNDSKDKIESGTETKRKRGRPRKEKEKNDSSSEVEVRRSRRQKTVKEDSKDLTKSILKKNVSVLKHENSAVYSMSSESDISLRSGKRSGLEMDVPSPKRTRSAASSNSSLRSTPARLRTQYVLFTAFPCEEVKTKLEKLGAVLVNDVKACTVVLTLQIKRTFKLLCAVGLGRPIVGPQWVQACVDNNIVVDPWLYLIKDTATEQRFKFDLQKTLSGKRNFLKGYHISSTPNVMPSPPEMKLIVECSGGMWKAQKPQWLCVSCSTDKDMWKSLKQQGAIIVSSEFILSGVLRQKMDIQANRLD